MPWQIIYTKQENRDFGLAAVTKIPTPSWLLLSHRPRPDPPQPPPRGSLPISSFLWDSSALCACISFGRFMFDASKQAICERETKYAINFQSVLPIAARTSGLYPMDTLQRPERNE